MLLLHVWPHSTGEAHIESRENKSMIEPIDMPDANKELLDLPETEK